MEHLSNEEAGRMRVLREANEEQAENHVTGHMNFANEVEQSSLHSTESSGDIFKDAASRPDRSLKRKWLRLKPHVLGFFFKLPLQFIYVLTSILILKWFGFNF